jgi:hypothetical protein
MGGLPKRGIHVAFEDYRMKAQVRAILVRRWVDLSKLEYSVTNGVIYLRGSLRPYLTERMKDSNRNHEVEVELATRLERSLRLIPGVRDVVFQLDRLKKVGWRWRVQ